jgi:flagellin
MALRINHNIASLNANRNLNQTTTSMEKSMAKLSSGYRINVAADDPAGLVISEQFRAQIAGLNRAIQNSEGSISMVQTAEGALTEINNLLIGMRELAIHAANEGFNDVDQLAADQAEIENAINTIDRIAANTQFGTKLLLDGSKENVASITSNNNTGLSLSTSKLSSGTHYVTVTKVADSTSSLNVQNLGLTLSNADGDPYNLTGGVHTVDVVQSSAGAQKISGAITAVSQDAFGNDFQIDATPQQASIAPGATITAAAGNAGTYTYYINYQENGASPIGVQSLSITVDADDAATSFASKLNAAIGANSELAGKVEVVEVDDSTSGIGTDADANSIKLQAVAEGTQYSVQTLATTYSGAGAMTAGGNFGAASDRGYSNSILNFDWNTSAGADVGVDLTLSDGTYADLSALVTEINTQIAASAALAAGSGTDREIFAEVYDTNRIRFSTRDEGSLYTLTLNDGTGTAGADNLRTALNLGVDVAANTGTDAIIRFDGYTNTVNRIDWAQATTSVTLENAAVTDSDRGTVVMSVGNAQSGLNAGSMLLSVTAAQYDVRLDGGTATRFAGGSFGTVNNSDRSESLRMLVGLTSSGGTETVSATDQSLVFQIGANVGQTESISLRNMSATALGQNLVGNLFTSLAQIDVTTVQGAQDAQSIIDASINEVSTTRGTLGSFQKNTLESNLRNLRVASQNLSASESVIRDTDMAMEMSNFSKDQILMQAGVAMLAQANQVPQAVLSLF